MAAQPIVLLVGDPYRCERALAERHQALRAADSTVERVAKFADEIDPAAFDLELQSTPLFTLGRHFVVRSVDRARKPKLWSDLVAKPLPQATFLTFVAAGDVKASNPLVKACKARNWVVDLPSPPIRSMAQTARGVLGECGVRFSPAVLEDLVARTGGDLLTLAAEARKFRAYAGETEITPAIVESLVFPGGEPTVYPFFDRLGERDLAGALRALDELRDDAGRILGGAVRHLARLAALRLLIEQRVPQTEMAGLLQVPDWLLRRLVTQARRFGMHEAIAALDLGVRLDTEVKSGVIAASDALLELVLSATSPPSAPPQPAGGTSRTRPVQAGTGSG